MSQRCTHFKLCHICRICNRHRLCYICKSWPDTHWGYIRSLGIKSKAGKLRKITTLLVSSTPKMSLRDSNDSTGSSQSAKSQSSNMVRSLQISMPVGPMIQASADSGTGKGHFIKSKVVRWSGYFKVLL